MTAVRARATSVRRSLALGGVVLALAATGCTGDSDDEATDDAMGMTGTASDADVDTPELRALKAAAGIQPCPATEAAAEPASDGLPSLTLPCLGGGRDVDLASLRGPAVINFWAQWCSPCRREAPIFQAAEDKIGAEVAVLGVDWMDPHPDAALSMADELGLTYPQLADTQGVTRADLGVQGLPYTLYLAADGSVTGVFGEVKSEEMLADALAEHLGVDPAWAEGS